MPKTRTAYTSEPEEPSLISEGSWGSWVERRDSIWRVRESTVTSLSLKLPSSAHTREHLRPTTSTCCIQQVTRSPCELKEKLT